MISCRDWWPWTKMEWRHTGSPRPQKFRVQKSAGKFSPRFFGIKTASASLTIFQRAKLSAWSITHLCWCNWKTFWRKNAAGSLPRGSCSCTMYNAPAHRALAAQKKLAYLGFPCLDHPPYSPDLAPSDYHLFPGLKKAIEMLPFFVRRGGHCCRRDLVGRTTFRIFFEWLAKVKATGQELYWASWGVCWINPEFGRCSLFPSWSG